MSFKNNTNRHYSINKRQRHTGASKMYTDVSTHPCLITVVGLFSVNIVLFACDEKCDVLLLPISVMGYGFDDVLFIDNVFIIIIFVARQIRLLIKTFV